MTIPTKTPVFVSFDYDHDAKLKVLLIGQAKNTRSPFFIVDWSIKKATKGWKAEAEKRIRRSKIVIVICGRHTRGAVGVASEIAIAKEAGVRYILLRGYTDGKMERPAGTSWYFDKMYDWTWDNLRKLTDTRPWWEKLR